MHSINLDQHNADEPPLEQLYRFDGDGDPVGAVTAALNAALHDPRLTQLVIVHVTRDSTQGAMRMGITLAASTLDVYVLYINEHTALLKIHHTDADAATALLRSCDRALLAAAGRARTPPHVPTA